MIPRFFVEPWQIAGDSVQISGEELVHLQRVLRLTPGSTVTICDGTGVEYRTVLNEILPEMAIAQIVQRMPSTVEPRVKITLVQGIPKADKMDFIIQKGTELGISEFLPIFTEHTVVQLSGAKALRRTERWQRIAKEAAKQSQRAIIPKVNSPITWQECITKYGEKTQGRLGLFPWEKLAGEKSAGEKLAGAGLKSVWADTLKQSDPSDIWVFIGPEGGWSETEAGEAGAMGITALSLGPRILRTETAGIVAAALILYEAGDLG